ncbi:hypothetical protein A4X13_0g5189 [Tilletia indica]|uniref:Uncharacterized protein n=1 Tax=Tilletia indica TaxID=43049 RepID=A0A8T8SVY5_9BASI|nr:hypothetical protein A4X13_0g5189 [Tilletia indica]
MVRHALSLNGKDFRALLAVVPSILPLIDADNSLDSLSDAWLAAARLGSALYVDSVERPRLDVYQTYVNRCISSIFHTLAKAAPEFLWSKHKLHLLCHAAAHFAFGPLSSVSAERFEAFNSIVRSAAVHSNRLRPSRVIANTILRQQDIRHILGAGRMADGGSMGTGLCILLNIHPLDDEHARKKQKQRQTMLDDDNKDKDDGLYDDDDKDNDDADREKDEDEIERSPLVATRTKKFKLNFGSPLPLRGESPEDFTD